MTDQEIWRAVPGYEGIYEVSSLARVRRLTGPKHRLAEPRILRQATRVRDGYRVVSLWRDGTARSLTVHRIVASAFIGPLPAGKMTRHIDGVKTNNLPSNLAYGTSSENMADTLRHRTHGMMVRTHCPVGHEYTPENTRFAGARRRCRECYRTKAREGRAKLRAAGFTSRKTKPVLEWSTFGEDMVHSTPRRKTFDPVARTWTWADAAAEADAQQDPKKPRR